MPSIQSFWLIYQHCRLLENIILSHKDNKSVCPAEVIKYGECALHGRLHNFIIDCWSVKCPPQQCKDANIILVCKQSVIEQNVATVATSPMYLCQAKYWSKSCSPVSSVMLQILRCLNLNAVCGVDAAQLI